MKLFNAFNRYINDVPIGSACFEHTVFLRLPNIYGVAIT